MIRYNKTERQGIAAVQGITINEFEWIFREQPIDDMGIDAHIEKVDEGDPKGKLLAVQIKTGTSHFKEKQDSYTYYGKIEHLDYWTNHSLPVLLVAHFPETDETYWVLVNENAVERTKKGWKINIPKANIFSKKCKNKISKAFDGSPAQQKLRKLTIDEPLMRHIENGGKVSVELEEWINKSLSRTPVKIFIIDDNGDEILTREWFFYYTGRTIEEFIRELFPWAEISIDEEFYEYNQDVDDWDNSISMATDEDNGVYYERNSFIYPYTNACGEVDFYRVELKLNSLGQSFLLVSEFMSDRD